MRSQGLRVQLLTELRVSHPFQFLPAVSNFISQGLELRLSYFFVL